MSNPVCFDVIDNSSKTWIALSPYAANAFPFWAKSFESLFNGTPIPFAIFVKPFWVSSASSADIPRLICISCKLDPNSADDTPRFSNEAAV